MQVRPGRAADHSPLLVPRSWKSRAIPLPSPPGHTGPVTGSLYLLPYIYIYIYIYMKNKLHFLFVTQ